MDNFLMCFGIKEDKLILFSSKAYNMHIVKPESLYHGLSAIRYAVCINKFTRKNKVYKPGEIYVMEDISPASKYITLFNDSEYARNESYKISKSDECNFIYSDYFKIDRDTYEKCSCNTYSIYENIKEYHKNILCEIFKDTKIFSGLYKFMKQFGKKTLISKLNNKNREADSTRMLVAYNGIIYELDKTIRNNRKDYTEAIPLLRFSKEHPFVIDIHSIPFSSSFHLYIEKKDIFIPPQYKDYPLLNQDTIWLCPEICEFFIFIKKMYLYSSNIENIPINTDETFWILCMRLFAKAYPNDFARVWNHINKITMTKFNN